MLTLIAKPAAAGYNLSGLLSKWHGLEQWSRNGTPIYFELQCQLTTQSTPVSSGSESEIRFPDYKTVATNALKISDEHYTKVKDAYTQEKEKVETIHATQKKLGTMALSDVDKLLIKDLRQPTDHMDGLSYYNMITSWLEELGRRNAGAADLNPAIEQNSKVAFEGQDRFRHLQELLAMIRSSSSPDNKPSPCIQKMRVLAQEIDGNLRPEDAAFFDCDDATIRAYDKSIQKKAQEVDDAKKRWELAKDNSEKVKPVAECIQAVWLVAHVTNQSQPANLPTRIVEFVDEDAAQN